jgi:hypothetical protein
MRLVRISIFFLFGITVLELIGYYVYSEQLLVGEIVQHYHPTSLVTNKEKINVYSNYQLNEAHKKDYTDVYTKEGIEKSNIEFFSDALTFERYIDQQDQYNYVLDVNFNAVPFAVVEEGENTVGTTAIWQSKYMWCLYKWVLIRKERPGQPAGFDGKSLQTIGI